MPKKYFKVFLTVFFSITIVSLISALVLGAKYKYDQIRTEYLEKIKDLTEKIQQEKNYDLKIAQMEKTLRVVYGLSPYESHYYSIIFNDFSISSGVPWEVYPALIRIESNFISTAVSPSGCIGLTQVKPSTGASIATKLEIPFKEKITLWNDILNLTIGLTYFNEGYISAIDSLGKDKALRHAIRRYCGGPGYSRHSDSSRTYVQEYKLTVYDEYTRLKYIYLGIQASYANN